MGAIELVFVIAEACVNFRNMAEADVLIKEASEAGADAVKFQAFKEEHVKGHPRYEELKQIILSEQDIRYLYWRCQARGTELIVTPFYPEAVGMLDPYVKRWKIRYDDRDNAEIINKCELTGKPMLISGKNIYCVPEYPALNIDLLKVPGADGFSSHFPFITPVAGLVGLYDLKYLEVHVKRDHYPDNYCPIDNNVSITMSELSDLCERLK